MLLRFPGVYPPQADTWLLADAIGREHLGPASRVLDLCTGTGAIGVRAAEAGAGRVTAVDVSRRAVLNARLNALAGRHPIRVVRGNLTAGLEQQQFDLIVSNPPYVPAADDALPGTGRRRGWDAGTNGRALLDQICTAAPELLAPNGVLLIAQSSLSGVEKTRTMLEEHGLRVSIAATKAIPFGPVLSSRRRMLEARGFVSPGQRTEDIYVLRALG